MLCLTHIFIFFFFNDTATTEIYTLSLHDALPICPSSRRARAAGSCPSRRFRPPACCSEAMPDGTDTTPQTICRDRKSTRLNSSHSQISYAVFCLKKKKKQKHR